jgi:hypothetical protein
MENSKVLDEDRGIVALQRIVAALEEIEAGLRITGGRITEISSELEHCNQPCAKVSIHFDMDKLKKHLTQKDAESKQKFLEAIRQGYLKLLGCSFIFYFNCSHAVLLFLRRCKTP